MVEQIANIDDTKLNIALLDALVLDFNPDNSEIIEKLLRKTKYAPAIIRLQALQPLPIPLAKAISELIKAAKLKLLEKGKFELQANQPVVVVDELLCKGLLGFLKNEKREILVRSLQMPVAILKQQPIKFRFEEALSGFRPDKTPFDQLGLIR